MAELLKAKEVYNSVVDKTIDYTDNAILRTPVEYDHSDTINPDKDMSIVSTESDIVLTLGTAPYEGYELPITNMASTGSCYVIFRAPNYSYTCIAIANQQTIKLRGVMEGRWELGNDETLAVYNLSNKPTGYNTPNDWKIYYGMGAHQFAYAGSGLDTSYSLPATDCIVTTAWQSVTQATAMCASGDNVWTNSYSNNAWGTWKEAGGQIFYITYNGSTADKTYTEIINAFGSGKIPVVKWVNSLYIFTTSDPSWSYPYIIFSKVVNPSWNTSGTSHSGNQSLDTLVCLNNNTWIRNSFNLQEKLNASTGITISGSTIKAQAEYLTLNSPSDAPNLSWSTIQSLDNSLRESPFKVGSYGDTSNGYGRLWLFQRNNNGYGTAKYVDLWSVWKDRNGRNNLLLRYGRTNNQSIEYSDYYIPPIKDTVRSDSTFSVSGTMFKDISPSNSDINITLQHGGSLLYDNITIQNKHNTSHKAIITYPNKDGVSSTISLSADQWAKFIWNGTGFVCECTVPFTQTDNQGNTITYDVVVRNGDFANYAITVEESENGSATCQLTAQRGEEVTISVSPDTGFELSSLTVTGDVSGTDYNVTEVVTNATYKFIMPAEAVSIEATFAEPSNIEYTYIVDSSQALMDWLTNESGNDYTNVFVTSGRHSVDYSEINNLKKLDTIGTKTIDAAPGAVICDDDNEYYDTSGNPKINGLFSYATQPTKDCYIKNLTIEFNKYSEYNPDDDSGDDFLFYNCINIENCNVSSLGTHSGAPMGCMAKCVNITNCTFSTGYTSTSVNQSHLRMVGGCKNITNSIVNIVNEEPDDAGYDSSFKLFFGCYNINNCVVYGEVSTKLCGDPHYEINFLRNCAKVNNFITYNQTSFDSLVYDCIDITNVAAVKFRDCKGVSHCKKVSINQYTHNDEFGNAAFIDCYADHGTANAVADTAAGGYNRVAS